MPDRITDQGSPFANRLLVAMPGLSGDSFARSVVYICAHGDTGAMGIVVNQRLADVRFSDLLTQLNIPRSQLIVEPPVHFGGPVDTGRGFVLHTTDVTRGESLRIDDELCITATVDILEAIATGRGPGRSLFALGYAGWDAGQLEAEMQQNAWLVAPPDPDLIFGSDIAGTWERAMRRAGISDLTALSPDAGHA